MNNLKKKVLSLLGMVLLLVPNSGFSQYFNALFDCDSSSDWGHTIFQNSDGNYLVYAAGLKMQNGVYRLTITKEGKLISTQAILAYNNSSFYMGGVASKVKQVKQGSILPLTVTDASATYASAGLALINHSGDTIFSKVYTDTSKYFEESLHFIELSDSGGFIAGYQKPNGMTSESGAGLLRRVDKNGNILWQKTYGGICSKFNSIELLTSGRLLLGGEKTSVIWVGPGDFYYRRKPRFMIADSATGTILKDTLYSSGYMNSGTVFSDKNGGYFHWGSLDIVDPDGGADHFNSFPDYFAHLDDNFRITWQKTFPTKDTNGHSLGHRYIWTVKQCSDDGYIMVGCIAKDLSIYGWAAKLYKNGFFLWERTYMVDFKTQAYLTDVIERPGGFIFTGSTSNTAENWRGQDVWLLSVDNLGCVVPGCKPTEITSNPNNFENAIMLYPNPITDKLIIENAATGTLMRVFDIVGRQVYSGILTSSKQEINLSHINRGSYIVQFISPQGNREVRKILKE